MGIILEILLLVFSKGHLHEAGDRCLSSSYKMNTAGFLVGGCLCDGSWSFSRQLSWAHSVCRELQVHSPRPSWPSEEKATCLEMWSASPAALPPPSVSFLAQPPGSSLAIASWSHGSASQTPETKNPLSSPLANAFSSKGGNTPQCFNDSSEKLFSNLHLQAFYMFKTGIGTRHKNQISDFPFASPPQSVILCLSLECGVHGIFSEQIHGIISGVITHVNLYDIQRGYKTQCEGGPGGGKLLA